jgi:hypothetical protein
VEIGTESPAIVVEPAEDPFEAPREKEVEKPERTEIETPEKVPA